MDTGDDGIFLFAKATKKVQKVEEAPLVVPRESTDIWEAVYRTRTRLPIPSKEILKSVVVNAEDIIRWANIYATTVKLAHYLYIFPTFLGC